MYRYPEQYLGDNVCDAILRRSVTVSVMLHLIADEVTIQRAALHRYVEPESSYIREYLVAFLECDSSVSGEALADKMLGFVTNHFDPYKMRAWSGL